MRIEFYNGGKRVTSRAVTQVTATPAEISYPTATGLAKYIFEEGKWRSVKGIKKFDKIIIAFDS